MFTKNRHHKFLGIALTLAALFVYGCSENPTGINPNDMQGGSVQTAEHDTWW